MIREIIAVEAKISGNGTRTAEEFGVSQAHANNLKRGIVTYNNGVDEKLARAIDARLDGVRSKAVSILDASLDSLSNQIAKGQVKPTTLSKIAADMSRIVERTEPVDKASRNYHLHLYRPKDQKAEEEFDTVEA